MITPSMIARSPLAPVLRSNAFLAIAINASSSNVSFTPSISNNLWYCFTRALFGSFKMRTKASSSNGFKDTFTGTRPMNSGIRPNFTKSSGNTCLNSSPRSVSFCPNTSAPNPIDFLPILDSMIFSNPSKAPPQINRILDVSI